MSGTEKKNKTVNITAPIIRSLACSLVMLIFTACSGEAPAIPDGQDAAAIQSGGAGRTEEGKETGESVESADTAESEEDADTSSGDVPEMEVHFIDVGQADATLIKIDGHAMLIDCGTDEVGTKVQYYLMQHDVDSLDHLVLTHPDSDHIGGADVIITKFDIGNVFMSPFTKDNNWYEDLMNALAYRNYDWSTPGVGSTYDLGEASFTIVAPNRIYDDPNNSSIALVLRYGDTRFLFTGDASEEAEADIVRNGEDISADVYKMGHHGSRSASADDFLEKVRPRYVVISCMTGNDYGHPHKEAMDRLRKYSPQIYRTDEQGTVVAYSDGKEISWDHEPSDTWACGIQTQEEIPVIYNDIMPLESVEDTDGDAGIIERGPAADVTYVLNTGSKRFHLPDCDSVTEMKPANRQAVDWTRDECIREGYRPCGNCKP